MERVRVAVLASDAITHAGLASCLNSRAEVLVVPNRNLVEVDVVVVAAERLTDGVAALRALGADLERSAVLVIDQLDPAGLLAAVECGVAAVIPRSAATDDHLIRVIQVAATGGGVLPSELVGELLREIARLQREVLAPRGISASGLTPRELDVVRLLAEGLDTADIAEKLAYSERTVKNVIYGMTNRLKLRNRPHAVAYAMRAGVI
ncbi:helix-turn-helix transcriptional regulator [Saccharopolyspora spinosa]|uniref:DNA-binding NarL/FixJ family response regulator n=1 Tax=Saccharopolyspora spinosa TaxID=60894 RepID=A0A2N3Y4X6_SACSN|nr:response regulator transcription factor [Saccharopolyspora spinosa]PKW17989.1 DNA-binding NarL/FixJ family response regulator [Saccharopolyspora spinosa]